MPLSVRPPPVNADFALASFGASWLLMFGVVPRVGGAKLVWGVKVNPEGKPLASCGAVVLTGLAGISSGRSKSTFRSVSMTDAAWTLEPLVLLISITSIVKVSKPW